MARIQDLCSVMGINYLHDPDPTYELTTDNVEKILAIHMRFRLVLRLFVLYADFILSCTYSYENISKFYSVSKFCLAILEININTL